MVKSTPEASTSTPRWPSQKTKEDMPLSPVLQLMGELDADSKKQTEAVVASPWETSIPCSWVTEFFLTLNVFGLIWTFLYSYLLHENTHKK